MSAVAAHLATAVVAALNAQAFAVPFTATRSWAPTFKLTELGTLRVTVAYGGAERGRSDRRTLEDLHTIEVGVQKKLSSIAPDVVDPMVSLLEEIHAFLVDRPLPVFPAARWVRSSVVTPALPEHLREMIQYTGVLSIQYRVVNEEDDE